jgi:hypothetical protein
MKRVLGILAGVGIALVVIGCAEPYDVRLRTTLENKRYQQTLNKNLEAAPEGSNLKPAGIYVRPPLGFKGPASTFALAVVEPGKFDITDSFVDTDKQASLHILARDNRPKAASPKKGADPSKTEPQAARGDFNSDVLDLVKSAYSVDVDAASLKAESKDHGARHNPYKAKTLDANTKEVQIWIYGDKTSPAQVALIFDYPKDARNSLASPINYCLQSFGVGRVAESLYAGRGDELSGEEAAPPPAGVF